MAESVKNAIWVLSAFGATLWYFGSRMMEVAGSPLELLAVTELIVSVAVYLV